MRLLLLAPFMVTQRQSVAVLCSAVLAFIALIASCSKVPLLAPTGSVINLYPQTNSVSLNSRVTIAATVIEQGVASSGSGSGGTTSRVGAGTPVHNGTHVTFTTTLGTIQPSDAVTENGATTVTYITGSTS